MRLDDDDPRLVEAMISYMYNLEYEICENKLEEDNKASAVLFDVQMYQMADKYDIPSLKNVCKEGFRYSASKDWNLRLFSLGITEVYSTTPRGDRALRDIVVEISAAHEYDLSKRVDFLEAIEATPAFAVDFVKNTVPRRYYY